MMYQSISCSEYQESYERMFENGQEKLVLSRLNKDSSRREGILLIIHDLCSIAGPTGLT